MRAGERNYLIVIERAGTPVDDGYTTQPGAWATWCEEYAAVRFNPGTERREAAQERASAVATFTVLANDKTRAVVPTDRIQFDSITWDITSNIPGRDYNAERDLEAIRADA
jgi:head-tail adaptor